LSYGSSGRLAVRMEDWAEKVRRLIRGLFTAMHTPADEVPLGAVVPVFVPEALASPAWPGPAVHLNVPGLAIVWAALGPERTMRYVTREMVASWTAKGVNWRDASMQNLQAISPSLCTHALRREDGEYVQLVMLHDDGIGPSRLLLTRDLERVFPHGYRCAIPERSVALAVSSRATSQELADVTSYVEHCFRNGGQPFLRGFFAPEDIAARGRSTKDEDWTGAPQPRGTLAVGGGRMDGEDHAPAFTFTIQHVGFIKPPVDRLILVGMIDAGKIRSGTVAVLHTVARSVPFTIEGIELHRAGETPEATAGQQVALRCVGLERSLAVPGMRVTGTRRS